MHAHFRTQVIITYFIMYLHLVRRVRGEMRFLIQNYLVILKSYVSMCNKIAAQSRYGTQPKRTKIAKEEIIMYFIKI